MFAVQAQIKNYFKKRKNAAEDKAFERELLKRYENKKESKNEVLIQNGESLKEQDALLRELAAQVMFELKDQRSAIAPKPPSKAIQTFSEFYEGAKIGIDFINYGFIKLLRKEDRAEIINNPLVQISLFLNFCACGIIFFRTSLEFYYLVYLLLQVIRVCIYIGNRSLYLEKLQEQYDKEGDGRIQLDTSDEEEETIEAGGRKWVKQSVPRRY